MNNKVQVEIEVKKIGQGIDDIKREFATLHKTTSDLASNFNLVGNAIKGFVAYKLAGWAAETARGFVETAASFEQLKVSLISLQGSSEAAEKSLSWIAEFTAKTPFTLDETSEAFKRLTAYGLDATKVLPMLGDTASALGKDLNPAVEMWTDAITGEFERLKEFGVKAKTEGDKVMFSFSQNGRDMVLEAQKTGEGITNALSDIFKRFEGGMAAQASTWKGLMSNMEDNWTLFKKEVMDSEGLFNVVKQGAIEFSAELQHLKETGQLKEWAKDMALGVISAFEGMIGAAQVFANTIQNIRAAWTGLQISFQEGQLARLQQSASNKSWLIDSGMVSPGSDVGKWLRGGTKENIAEQQGVYDQLHGTGGLYSELSGIADTKAAITNRFAEIREAINRVKAASQTASPAVAETGKQLGVAGAKAVAASGGLDKAAKSSGGAKKAMGEAAKSAKDLSNEIKQITEANLTPFEKIGDQTARLEELMKSGALVTAEYRKAFDNLTKSMDSFSGKSKSLSLLSERSKGRFEDTYGKPGDSMDAGIRVGGTINDIASAKWEDAWGDIDKTKDKFSELKDAINGWGKESAGAIADWVTGVKASFSDLTQSIIKDLVQMAVYKSITEPLFGEIGKGVSSMGSWFSGLWGGGRAAGGPVFPGLTYLVGERGPELLTMGAGSGTVTPNGALGGQVFNMRNSFNVSVAAGPGGQVDPKSAEAAARIMAAQLEGHLVQLMEKHKRNGGTLARR